VGVDAYYALPFRSGTLYTLASALIYHSTAEPAKRVFLGFVYTRCRHSL